MKMQESRIRVLTNNLSLSRGMPLGENTPTSKDSKVDKNLS